jgi:parallel beta-helix repeat protein
LAVGADEDFPTIQEALAHARPGDTVELAPGEYRGPVRLKSGVTLRSRSPREAVIRAPLDGSGPVVLAESVTGARLVGLHIAASGSTPPHPVEGIVLIDSSVELFDSEVEGASIGIDIRGAASPILIGNGVHDCAAEGILISGPSEPRLSHNALLRNGRAGVAARDNARPLLLANVFEKNVLDLPPGSNLDAVRAANFFVDVKPQGGRKR